MDLVFRGRRKTDFLLDSADERTYNPAVLSQTPWKGSVGDGTPGPTACCMGGRTIDFVSPLTMWSIWIGRIAAPIEIVPTHEPASDGIPSVLANCFDKRSLPPVMVNDWAAAS